MLYRPPTTEEKRGVVVLVEGEKDVDRLRALGFAATTVSEGYLTESLARQYLKGCTVAVLSDYDQHGRHARDAALAALDGIAKHAFFIQLPGLRWRRDRGKDVSDWLDQGGTRRRLAALIQRGLP
jgi:DNA primase